jgi:hypothetical protein
VRASLAPASRRAFARGRGRLWWCSVRAARLDAQPCSNCCGSRPTALLRPPPPPPFPQIRFVFSSPLLPEGVVELGQDMAAHQARHGDGVKDVAFAVDDVARCVARTIPRFCEAC